MSPEEKLTLYVQRINLLDEDLDYLLSLLEEARSLGPLAGAAVERRGPVPLLSDEEWQEKVWKPCMDALKSRVSCVPSKSIGWDMACRYARFLGLIPLRSANKNIVLDDWLARIRNLVPLECNWSNFYRPGSKALANVERQIEKARAGIR